MVSPQMLDNPRPASFNNRTGCFNSGPAEWLRFAACFSNASPGHSGSTPSSSTATELKLMPNVLCFSMERSFSFGYTNKTSAYHGDDKNVCDM